MHDRVAFGSQNMFWIAANIAQETFITHWGYSYAPHYIVTQIAYVENMKKTGYD